jgi:hypothetical protein
MEYELLALFLLHTVGVAVFGRFEAETAWWRLVLKWMLMLLITWLLFYYFGHLAAFGAIALLFTSALIFHFTWCYKNGIHLVKATPRKKYYAIRKWKWEE